MTTKSNKPSFAFIGASWLALLTGVCTYLFGLWNSALQLNEKGFYFAVICLGLFAAISLQKTVRDKQDNIPVTGIYLGLCWVFLAIAIGLLIVGLFNATLAQSEKGFYAMSFVLSLFAAVAVQKNIRDVKALDEVATPTYDQ